MTALSSSHSTTTPLRFSGSSPAWTAQPLSIARHQSAVNSFFMAFTSYDLMVGGGSVFQVEEN
jgi:hypothetical protein